MEIVNNPKTIDGHRVIQDYDEIEKALINKEIVYHWEFGDSMSPLINNMEYCKIIPCMPIDVNRGDAVFCIITDSEGTKHPMVHQVWEIASFGHDKSLWFKIGSTGASIFGWTKKVLGKAYGTNIFQEFFE